MYHLIGYALSLPYVQYFTLSGLRTNLGLLNDGVAWGYTVIVCLVAFASKFVACALSALAFGFRWREAGAIGSLMSCKGYAVLQFMLSRNVADRHTGLSNSSY